MGTDEEPIGTSQAIVAAIGAEQLQDTVREKATLEKFVDLFLDQIR